jgi:hypothetical protein
MNSLSVLAFLLEMFLVTVFELVNTASGVNEFRFAREERV